MVAVTARMTGQSGRELPREVWQPHADQASTDRQMRLDARLLRLVRDQVAAAHEAALWIVAREPADSQLDQVAAAWLGAAQGIADILDAPGPAAATAQLDAPWA